MFLLIMAQTRKKRKKNNDNNCSSSIESSHQQKKKKKKKKKELISSWSSLPNDVLLNIFNRLDDRIYLFWIVSSVCRSWQLACWEILFWKGNEDDEQFDLGGLPRFCYDEVEDNFDKLDLALGNVMRSVFDRHGDIFDDIRYKFHDMMLPLVHNKDKYLVYVAERTPKLQKVSLDMHGITGKGFSRSIRNWRQLEVIFMVSLSGCHCTHIIQEIGINCGKLKMFNILSCTDPSRTRFSLNEYNCQVIADNLCNLRASGISNCYINKLGLLIIMSKCKQLKRLCLIRCIRALEDVKLTRGRGALDAKPLKVIPEPLSVFIQKCEGSDSEWWINTLPGKHNIRSVISHLWMEPRDVLTSI